MRLFNRWMVRFGLIFITLVAGSAAGVAPAQAGTADLWGYAYQNNLVPPAAWAMLSPGHQWGSWKSANPAAWAEARHLGTGRYQVRFPDLASGSRGIVHVTAVSPVARYCAPVAWFSVGTFKVVDVQCANPLGTLADSKFTIMFTVSSGTLPGTTSSHAYVHYDNAVLQTYNSTGGANAVAKIGVGLYSVTFPGVGAPGVFSGNLQATAIAATSIPPRCKIVDWKVGPDVVATVQCYAGGSNAPADTAFVVSYHRQRAVTGELGPPSSLAYVWSPGGGQSSYNSTGGINTITDVGPLYTVELPGVATVRPHAQVTAYGPGPAWCLLFDPWFSLDEDGNLVLEIRCVAVNGMAINHDFFATYTPSV